MPTNRTAFSVCGHKGHGAFCHRCKEAERLEGLAKQKGTSPEDAKKHGAEAARLRGPRRKKGERMTALPAQAEQPSS